MRPTDTETGPDPLLVALQERRGPHVVAVGGGHGLAQVLTAAVSYAGRIDAVVSVADDGGSSGRLAPALDIPPPGDIRKCLVALTPEESVWKRLFEYRFVGADVSGHSLGNLIIAALAEIEGSFEGALRSSERLLGSLGSVIPASPLHLRLAATLDGREVVGQVEIAKSRGTITAMRLIPDDPPVTATAVTALEGADQIVLGPGSLYTSVIAALLVPGITPAINRSSARLVLVANLITQDGETLQMDAAEHLDALLHLTGVRPPSAIVAPREPVAVEPPLAPVPVDEDVLATYGVDVVFGDLRDPNADWPQHDPERLAEILRVLTPN